MLDSFYSAGSVLGAIFQVFLDKVVDAGVDRPNPLSE
jgi:hypothetical protein